MRIIVYILVAAIATLGIAGMASAMANPGMTVAGGGDPMLAWLQAAGFPAWAIVLVWFGNQIVSEIKSITRSVDSAKENLNSFTAALKDHILQSSSDCRARRRHPEHEPE